MAKGKVSKHISTWVEGKGITDELPVFDKGTIIHVFRNAEGDFTFDSYNPNGQLKLRREQARDITHFMHDIVEKYSK